MNRFFSLLAIVLIFTLASSAKAQNPLKFRAHVTVNVRADEELKGTVISHINRELTNLKDVRLDDHEPEWKLQVQATEVLTNSGNKSGIALSMVILCKFSDHRPPPLMHYNNRKTLDKKPPSPYYYADNLLKTGSMEDLTELCSEIVTEFNTRYLEENRKNHKYWVSMLRGTFKSAENNP